MTAHAKSKPLFDLAQPFSALMQAIETGSYSDFTGAALLYALNTTPEQNAETVIDQYTLATNRNVKARAVSITEMSSHRSRCATRAGIAGPRNEPEERPSPSPRHRVK